jgi:3-dehydroquinate synthase
MKADAAIVVPVALAGRSYDITVAAGLIGRAGDLVPPPASGRPTLVVTDENVAALHLGALERGLGRPIEPVVLSPGEQAKSWSGLEALVERMLAHGVERGDAVIAFGGGVVGDLTGFAAAITRRGCDFIQVPTTLLAQVDSSVGGKTAINAAAGKNLIGAFHQPRAVLIDPELLATLPPRELRAGYAEVVKYGLLGDADFFAWCEASAADVLAGDRAAEVHAIAHSCRMKAAIVAEDERETSGRRALLNLGHTFGHAFEAETGFSDRLLHGEAVSLGMVAAFEFAARRGICPEADAARVRAHLESVGLPADFRAFGFDPERLAQHMRQDKKAAAGRVAFVLPRRIGEAFLDRDVALEDVAAFLAG